MQYSPEFLSWREAEYRLAEAEASLRCSVESAEANPPRRTRFSSSWPWRFVPFGRLRLMNFQRCCFQSS